MVVLKSFTDSDVQAAGYQVMETLKFFPKPADIVDFIRVKNDDARREQTLTEAKHCQKCGERKQCILDDETNTWLCQRCYTGMTPEQCKERIKLIIKKLLERKGF